MKKSQKATYLQVKRIFFEEKENRTTVVHPKHAGEYSLRPPGLLEDDAENKNKKRRILRQQIENSENSENSESPQHSNSTQKTTVPAGVSGTFNKIFEVEDKSIFEIVTGKTKQRNRIVDRLTVKSGWASNLAMFLFKNADLHCKFDFKNIWITKDGRINTLGKCECKGEVHITHCSGRLCVNAKNISNDFDHKRSYQIRGEFKKKTASKSRARNCSSCSNESTQ